MKYERLTWIPADTPDDDIETTAAVLSEHTELLVWQDCVHGHYVLVKPTQESETSRADPTTPPLDPPPIGTPSIFDTTELPDPLSDLDDFPPASGPTVRQVERTYRDGDDE